MNEENFFERTRVDFYKKMGWKTENQEKTEEAKKHLEETLRKKLNENKHNISG